MKFAVVIDFNRDKATIDRLGKEHHEYLSRFLHDSSLFAAGRRTEHDGALWVVDAVSADRVAEMVRGDPFHAAGVVTGWQTFPLANWSAKENRDRTAD